MEAYYLSSGCPSSKSVNLSIFSKLYKINTKNLKYIIYKEKNKILKEAMEGRMGSTLSIEEYGWKL